MQLSKVTTLPIIASLFSVSVLAQSAQEHTAWCFLDETNNRLIDQPMDRGNCSALLAGGAALAYFSGNERLTALLLNERQNNWADDAATLSCTPGALNNQLAIRLIQACQCHNTGAQDSIENNQTEVLATLRNFGGCG